MHRCTDTLIDDHSLLLHAADRPTPHHTTPHAGKETVDSLEKALVTPTASSPPRAGAFVRYDSVGHVISRAVRVPAFDDTSYGSDPCPLGLEIGSKANGQFVVSLCGDVICRTDKVETFTVTASSGATVIGGTLKVANALAGSSTPPKLTVEAETANLVITKGGAGAGGGDRDVFKVEAATGTVTAQGEMLAQSFIALSDKRLKQNIVKLESGRALDVVASLRPTTYQMKNEPGDERCGLVAQEVATVLPACVKPHPGGVLPADEDDEERKKQPDVLGVNYTDIIGYLIGSIHELSRRVDALARVPPSSSAPSADGRDSAAPPPPSEDDEDADGG